MLQVSGEEEIKNRGLISGRENVLSSQAWLPMRFMVMNYRGHVTIKVTSPTQSVGMTRLSAEN